jgi:hypothetical protein
MNQQRIILRSAVAAMALMASVAASAQATRTWVSGVGDDANPCSRTAPCKTFAGAISKTIATGEISVLDPGGYGAVTITKSITISGDGTLAGIVNTGTNGIIVNAGPSDVVILRNLSINGSQGSLISPGFNGIKILAAGSVHVENCNISRNTQTPANGNGIWALPSTVNPLRLFVNNTTIQQNGQTSGSAGILIQPTGSGRVIAEIGNSRIQRNASGIVADNSLTTGAVIVAIHDSEVTGNLYDGILAHSGASGSLRVAVSESFISDNGYGTGATNQAGVRADGAVALIRIYNNHIGDNQFGVNLTNSGKIYSAGGNMISYNTTNGVFTGTQPTQ